MSFIISGLESSVMLIIARKGRFLEDFFLKTHKRDPSIWEWPHGILIIRAKLASSAYFGNGRFLC